MIYTFTTIQDFVANRGWFAYEPERLLGALSKICKELKIGPREACDAVQAVMRENLEYPEEVVSQVGVKLHRAADGLIDVEENTGIQYRSVPRETV